MKKILIFLFSTVSCIASDKLFFNDGNSLEAEIVEANETHVTIKRAEDLQLFRFEISLLTKDCKRQGKLMIMYTSEDYT